MKTMAQTSSPLVLIIDDEPDILELLDLTLQRMQVQTCSASTMAEAMALLAEKHFDLCLTDMRLPDGDGLAVVRHIQQNLPQTPVAMITAYGSLDTAISALKAGAFDFLTKPVDLQRLRELVNSALRLKPEQAAEPGDQARDPILGISPAIEHRNIADTVDMPQSSTYIYIFHTFKLTCFKQKIFP